MRRWAVATLAVAAALAVPQAAHAFAPLGAGFRISFMGPDGSGAYLAGSPSVAYNPAAGEYLVVWEGDDNTPPLVDNEFEIFAQRLSGSGVPLGGRIRVSAQGADGDPGSVARTPSVAYNPSANEYLVAWEGEVGATGEFEIWGRRLSAAGARLGGSDDLRISDLGPDGDGGYDAGSPSVAYNPAAGEYLVVWEGDDNTPPLVKHELEIFGQRLSAAGVEAGGDFRVSEQGADGVTTTSASEPSVAYSPAANEYLVAWTGEDGVSDEDEIWAQRLSATGAEVGGSDFRISDMGPDGDADYNAFRPSVAANPTSGGYLVVWQGDDDTGLLNEGEFEIFSQRLTATGAQTGANDFRVSATGPPGDKIPTAAAPSVAAGADEYLVVWRASEDLASFEIYGQQLPATGSDAVEDDVRISRGSDGNALFYQARDPSIAYDSSADAYLAVWPASGNPAPFDPSELEIFGQRLGVPPLPPPGGETPGGGAPGVTEPPHGSGAAPGSGVPAAGGRPAFGAKTLVTLALARRRIAASGPLEVRVTNRNAFAIQGRLAARTTNFVPRARKRRIALEAKSLSVAAGSARTVALRLPRTLRRLLARTGKLSLRLTARLADPAGNRRTLSKKVTPRLKRKRWR